MAYTKVKRKEGGKKDGGGMGRGGEERRNEVGRAIQGRRESLGAVGVTRGKRKRLCKYIVFAFEIIKKFLNGKH